MHHDSDAYAHARIRLLSKLDRSGGPTSCWPFRGALKPSGYGNFYLFGRTVGAHVASYRLFCRTCMIQRRKAA